MHKASFFVAALSLLVLTWAGLAFMGVVGGDGPERRPASRAGVARDADSRTAVTRTRPRPHHRRAAPRRRPIDDAAERSTSAQAKDATRGPDHATAVRATDNPGGESAGGQSMKPDSTSLVPVDEEDVAIPEKPPEQTTEVAPGHWVLSAADERRVRTEHQRILETEIRFAARYNRHVGRRELYLEEVVPGGELARFGFRSGDVLVSIDGQPVESRSQVARYFQEHPEKRSFLVAIRRLGKLIRKRFTAP